MKLSGLHILLTYQCTFECDHCFTWGSPWQSGTLTMGQMDNILKQAQEAGVRSIYFEGGEPFLYYPILIKAVEQAAELGFRVGIVSNAYWANSPEDAIEWLRPLTGLVQDLSVSSDLFHYSEMMSQQAKTAEAAAEQLQIPVGTISIASPGEVQGSQIEGQLPLGESNVMYRGRAVYKLVDRAVLQSWENFDECPFEDMRDPGRVHLDPLGNLHICQGISIGNLFEKPLVEICATYDPESHPIIGPLLQKGPVGLIEAYQVAHEEQYADACHLCYILRLVLRERFAQCLTPDQMYGVFETS